MITERDLQEAIAECQGTRNPTANTCLKLAAYYTIQDRMFPSTKPPVKDEPEPTYSYAPPPEKSVETVTYSSDSEFSQVIEGKDINKVLAVIDEMMGIVEMTQPRLYNGVLSKIELDI